MRRTFLPPRVRTGADCVLDLPLDILMNTGKVFDHGSKLVGTVTAAVPKFPAFYFNGAAYINMGSTFQSTFRNSFSILLWAKPDDGNPPGLCYFAGCQNADVEDSVLLSFSTSGKLQIRYSANTLAASALANLATFTDGQQNWKHVGFTAEANQQLRIYENGVELALQAAPNDGDATGIVFANYTSLMNLFLGCFNLNTSPAGYVSGSISEILIYNRLLTATDVVNIYNLSKWRYGR